MIMTKRNLLPPLLALLLLCLSTAAFAAQPAKRSVDTAAAPVRVVDEANILSTQERQILGDRLVNIEKAHRVHIAVYTVKDLKGEKAGTVANKLVDTLSVGAENGAMVLLLAPKERDWTLATDSKMRTRIPDGTGTDYITGKFLPAFGKDNYAEGFNAYAAAADEMLVYYEKEGKPLDPGAGFSFLALGIAAALAAGVFFLVRSILIGSMSNVTAAAEADAYLNRETFQLTRNDDTFLYISTTRRPKPKKSNTASRDESHGGSGGKY